MSTFYTPSLDELCHGFEMEVLSQEEWIPTTFTIRDWPYQQNEIRVKYLSPADITAMGFHFKSKTEDQYCYTKPISSLFSNDYVTLWYTMINEKPHISLLDSSNQYVLAPVFIQNKQELKWLLNRYGY